MWFRRSLAALCALLVASAATAQSTRPGFAPGSRAGFQFSSPPLPGPKQYIIGVYQQPVVNHATWKARGVNTLFVVPAGTTTDAWATSAKSLGLKQIRYPKGITFNGSPTGASVSNYTLTDPAAFAADMRSGDLLAAAFFDEPSNIVDGSGTLGYGHGAFDPAMMAQVLATWRGYGVPTWLNELGNHHRIASEPAASYMRAFKTTGMVDWFSSDSYQVSDGRPFASLLDGTWSTDQGHDLDRQRAYSGGRPVMPFIETCPINTGNAQITASQFSAQLYSSIIHGAAGHSYFPIAITPSFSFDCTPQTILDAMGSVHSYIASIHDTVLMDTVNGGRRPFVVRDGMPSGTSPTGLQLPFPFEGAEITASDGRTYRALLNLSSSAQTITDSRWGLSGLSVPAYSLAYGYNATEMAASLTPVVYAAFNSAQKSNDLALSNSNRITTVATDANDFYKSVISDTAFGSRKVYWEVTFSGFTNNSDQAGSGVTTSTTKLGSSARMSGTANTMGLTPGNGAVTNNNVSPFTIGSGDGTYGFAVDGPNNKIWVRQGASGNWNNSGTANPATNAGGYDPVFDLKVSRIIASLRDINDAVTINTGNAAFVGTPPAGFGNP